MSSPWPPGSVIVCLVTDRQALARALGGPVDPLAALERQVAGAVEAEIDLVQIRERDLGAGILRDVVGACAERASGSRTRIVVNDRLDVALAAGAHGVHLRGDSYAAVVARRVVPPGFLVGRSIRSAAEAAPDEAASYLVLGTVFATPSKPGATMVGSVGLRRAALAASAPVLAIGGVSEDRLAEIAAAGAAGFAAIRLFFGLGEGDAARWRGRLAQWRDVFDRNRPIS